ncbi:MAG TPA: cation:proton antiporter [Pyrinomonadaceae bacterium]|nr:cation:proton antiporter [Pyrinomonadaceae bacterium]
MPHSFPLLQDLLTLLAVSVPIAFIFHRLRLPTIVGFMITGVLIGPYGLGLIRNVEGIELMAEIGVALLLFTIGLEFSLRRLLEMKRLVLLGGSLQVVLSGLVTMAIAYGLGRPVSQAIFFGFLFALSSTAIVLKTYIDRAEVDAPHGRAAVGILLFQDLSIVPMMLMIPILSGRNARSTSQIVTTFLTALIAITVIYLATRRVVPYLLHHIVRLRSPEVFIISVVLICLGTSFLTMHFGLSLALGAFIAGMVLSESEYNHQIIADILPFRDVFNSLFFVSIGMLLSLGALTSNIVVVILWVTGLILIKAAIALAVVRILGYSLRVATMTAIGLSQIGEFSFILAKTGVPEGLLDDLDYQRFLAASILSMIATPFLIKAAPRIGYALQSLFGASSALEPNVPSYQPEEHEMNGHVIIVGYGFNGRNLAKVLRRTNVPYLVLELNADAVRSARAEGERVIYGDATRREVLNYVGIDKARVLVLAISDPVATRHTVWLGREMNPEVHIIVRTRYMSEITDLRELGSDEIIPEEFETSIEIFSRVLKELGMPSHIIQRQVAAIRSEGYEILRLPSLPMVDMVDIADALGSAATETFIVPPDSRAAGMTIGTLKLRTQTGVSVIALIHDGSTEINPGPESTLNAGDVMVLLGTPDKIHLAVEKYLGTN